MADRDVKDVIAVVEEDYDGRYHQGLIDQIEIIYGYLRLFCKQQCIINKKSADYFFH